MSVEYDYYFKVILAGDSGVGKTTALGRLSQDFFTSTLIPTIGVDYKVHIFTLDGKRIRMQIWDTAGQEKFGSIASRLLSVCGTGGDVLISSCFNSYFRSADGVLLFYDITDRKSFDHIDKWINAINENCQSTVIKMIVGNKSELLSKRKVSFEEGEHFATKNVAGFFETSAITGDNISEVFTGLARLLKMQADATKTNGKKTSIDLVLLDYGISTDSGVILRLKNSCCNRI